MVAPLIADSTWHGVEDPRKRKQIQDRLAQRARRKRLAEAKANKSSPLSASSSSSPSHASTSPSPVPCLSGNGSRSIDVARPSDPESAVHIVVPVSVYAALFVNGQIMGLQCGCVIPHKSPSFGPEVPESLQPTAIQKLTYHLQWIDRFPFPKMRDNIITLTGIIDEEEFLGDLFSMESFTIKPGAACWDPSAWVISKEFAKKWGFLFH